MKSDCRDEKELNTRVPRSYRVKSPECPSWKSFLICAHGKKDYIWLSRNVEEGIPGLISIDRLSTDIHIGRGALRAHKSC